MELKALAKRFYQEFVDDAVTDSAAQLSYYFLFALFPFLFFLVTLTAYLPLQGAVDELIGNLAIIMPGQALGLIKDHLKELLKNPHPKALTIGLLVAVWSA